MKQLRKTENPIVLRTDFSNRDAWQTICAAIEQPIGDFRAYVDFVDEPEYADATKKQVVALVPENTHAFLVVVDAIAISSPDYLLLVVDLIDEPGREFRAPPAQIQSIENNLSIANMDFKEFADSVDENGVFRGF